MTCDNLRGLAKSLECVMCTELESVYLLFFECIVARIVWNEFSVIFKCDFTGFESLTKFWLCNKRNLHLNVASAAVLWGLWNNRNALVFNRCTWVSVKQVLGLVLWYLNHWTKLFEDLQGGDLERFQVLLKLKLRAPLELKPD